MQITNALLPLSLANVNWKIGRGDCPCPIDGIVVHCTEGDAASVRAWFNDPKSEVSSAYMVQRDGAIVQFVEEDDKAQHAGKLVHPTNRLTLERYAAGKWTPNSWAVGIEFEADGTEELTDSQRAAGYALMLDIIARRKIPIDRDHVFGHHEVRADKTCPGAISVDRIVTDLAAMATLTVVAEPTYPRLVWSRYENDYLVVTNYIDDSQWDYLGVKELAKRGHRATTPLSQMPLSPRSKAGFAKKGEGQ